MIGVGERTIILKIISKFGNPYKNFKVNHYFDNLLKSCVFSFLQRIYFEDKNIVPHRSGQVK